MTLYAHVGGLPVEEALLQFAPAGVALVAAFRITRLRFSRRRRRPDPVR